MKYIDIHSHIQSSDFDEDRDDVISRMNKNEIGTIVVGTDFESSKKAIRIAEENKNIFASVGLHPNDNKKEIFDIKKYKILAQNKKVVAIGECGLDYLIKNEKKCVDNICSVEEKERQKKNFVKQIELAVELDLPLMLHIRDAHCDAIKILEIKKFLYGEKLRGNVHFFSGSEYDAKKYFDLNFTISFTGVITFTNDYEKLVKNSPLEMIMAETDSPFVAPLAFRGKRNEPSFVTEIFKKIAEIKNEDFEKTRTTLLENTRRVFSIRS